MFVFVSGTMKKKKKKTLWRFKKKVYKEIPQPCCTENQTVYRNQDNDWCWITAMIPSDLEVIYILDFGKNSHYVSTTLMCISVYTTHVWVTINPWFDLYTRHDCQTCCLSVSAFYLDSSVTWCERSVTLVMSDLQVEPALFLIVLILRTENERQTEREEKKRNCKSTAITFTSSPFTALCSSTKSSATWWTSPLTAPLLHLPAPDSEKYAR